MLLCYNITKYSKTEYVVKPKIAYSVKRQLVNARQGRQVPAKKEKTRFNAGLCVI